jgi:GR25 family glycosyltransferase involved in LPS biosynthesis
VRLFHAIIDRYKELIIFIVNMENTNIKFYWINMDKCKDRKEFMEKQFNIYKIQNERIEAITPETLETIIEDKPPYNCGSICCSYNNNEDCKYEYSCIASHLKAIKKGVEDNYDFFAISEDDIYLPFELNLKKIIEDNSNLNFDILQLMVLDQEANINIYNSYYLNNIQFIPFNPELRLFSTGLYLISRKGALKLIELYTNTQTNKFDLRKSDLRKQADFFIYMSVNTYTASFPYCIPNLKFISQIHPHHFYVHKYAIDTIIENINKGHNKNPYLGKHVPLEQI